MFGYCSAPQFGAVRLRSPALFGSAVRRCSAPQSPDKLPRFPPQVLVPLLVDGGGNPIHDKEIEKKNEENLGEI